MIINGKYNDAKVFTEKIDDTTISQIINLCNQEMFKDSKIKIMPDCHAGKGCTIGTTMTITDKIVPNLVGVDIGCGVAGIIITKEMDLDKLDNIIRTNIPHGFATHSQSRERILNNVFGIDLHDLRCDVNIDRAFLSAGTLGGGNHFIEVNKSEDGTQFLMVHTGSRNLGKNIAEFYQKKAIEYCTNSEDIEKPQNDLCYLEGQLMQDYLHDMNIAQAYAIANRVLILTDIIYNYFEIEDDFEKYLKTVSEQVVECTHNYIDLKHNILRKGAISAQKDEIVFIPINMRDGIIIGTGKGNPDWNYSAPHGAGRILSRSKAKKQVSIEEYQNAMKGVYTTCISTSTLDECPQAYKPLEDILDNINDTVEIYEVLKPVYNFKGN